MAEGVAEIEQRALAVFALVGGDDRRLGGTAPAHRLLPHRRIAGDERGCLGLEPVEEAAVADKPVFHHLGIARKQLAPRQGRERVDIGNHQHRLVKGADQVLALRRVDRRLAADGAVDLGEQRRRHLHQIEAAQQGRRGEAGEIADDAAAQRHDRRRALDAQRQDVLAQPREMREVLGRLARRQDHRLMRNVRARKARGEAREMQLRHMFVGDDDRAPLTDHRRDQRARLVEEPTADDDVVAAPVERDGDTLRRHGTVSFPVARCAASAAMTRSTVASGGPSMLSTVRSASA